MVGAVMFYPVLSKIRRRRHGAVTSETPGVVPTSAVVPHIEHQSARGSFYNLALGRIGFGTNAALPAFAVVFAINNIGMGHGIFIPVLCRKDQLPILHNNAVAGPVK